MMLATRKHIGPDAPADDWPLDRAWLDEFGTHLSRVDVVSFDVFDTAITRRCDAPVDAFALAEERLLVEIGEGVGGFAVARELAEQDARIFARAQGREEVTFAEIYAALPQRLPGAGRYLDRLRSAEIKAEVDLLFGVPEILEAVRLARRADKKVIFVSDMYLPSMQIRQFLENAGYADFDELLVSSETGCLKGSGQQWARLRERLGAKIRILHVGDDPVADVNAPGKYAIKTLAFTKVRSTRRLGGPLEPAVLPFSRAVRSCPIKLRQSTREVDGWDSADFMSSFGASWGTVVVGSFIRWLEDRVRRYGIERLFFLARDGWLLQHAWEAAGCEARTGVPASYLHVSRRTLNLAEAAVMATNDGLDEQALDRLCNTLKPLPLHVILGRAGLLECVDLVVDAAKALGGFDAIVTWPGVETLRSLLLRHQRSVAAALRPTRDATLGYIAQHVPECRRLGIVDLGWSGTLQASFAKLIRELRRDVRLSGFYYSIWPQAQRHRPYIGWLEGAFGSDFIPFRDQFGLLNAAAILENLHSAPEGTTVSYGLKDGVYTPVLDERAVESEQHATLIAPFQASTLEATGKLFTTGRFGALQIDDLTPAAGRAAIERVALSPSVDELKVLGQIRHSADFDHTVFAPLIPPNRASHPSPLETDWPVGAALVWLRQGRDRADLASSLRNFLSEMDVRTVRQFT